MFTVDVSRSDGTFRDLSAGVVAEVRRRPEEEGDEAMAFVGSDGGADV